jgi:hypothetical protein
MVQAIASVVGAAVLVLSFIVRALSAQPRMLAHIKAEAEACNALPPEHPGRDVLAKELTASIQRYEDYRGRSKSRYEVGFGLYSLASACVSFGFLGVLSEKAADEPWRTPMQVALVVVGILLVLGAGVFLWSGLSPTKARIEALIFPITTAEKERKRTAKLAAKEKAQSPEGG